MDARLLTGLLILTSMMWVVALLSHYLDKRYVKKKKQTSTYTNTVRKVSLGEGEANQEATATNRKEGIQ